VVILIQGSHAKMGMVAKLLGIRTHSPGNFASTTGRASSKVGGV
jgi:hypothetical protein